MPTNEERAAIETLNPQLKHEQYNSTQDNFAYRENDLLSLANKTTDRKTLCVFSDTVTHTAVALLAANKTRFILFQTEGYSGRTTAIEEFQPERVTVWNAPAYTGDNRERELAHA